MRREEKIGIRIIICLSILLTLHAERVIDDCNTNPPVTFYTSFPMPSTTITFSNEGNGIIGGVWGGMLDCLASEEITGGVELKGTEDSLYFKTIVTNCYLGIQYDGDDNIDSFNQNGLGNLDFTASGNPNAFTIDFENLGAINEWYLFINLYSPNDPSASCSSGSWRVNALSNPMTQVNIPLSAFSGSCDFSDISSISITINAYDSILVIKNISSPALADVNNGGENGACFKRSKKLNPRRSILPSK